MVQRIRLVFGLCCLALPATAVTSLQKAIERARDVLIKVYAK